MTILLLLPPFCGQESHTRNGVALIISKKSLKYSTWGNLKNDSMIAVCFQSKSFNITVLQVYAHTTDAKEADQFYEGQGDLLELVLKKRCCIHHWELECKVGSQDIPGVKPKFGLGEQNEVGQRLTEFCQENTVVIANTLFQQHER